MPNLSEDIRSELEREVALAQREAELTRREGALARAEAERAVVADEGLAARERSWRNGSGRWRRRPKLSRGSGAD